MLHDRLVESFAAAFKAMFGQIRQEGFRTCVAFYLFDRVNMLTFSGNYYTAKCMVQITD